MIGRDQAVLIAKKYVGAMSERSGIEIVLNVKKIMDKDYGWVFFYNSAEFYQTGDPGRSLIGNGPFIVEKDFGDIVQLSSALPLDELLKGYEDSLRNGS